MFRTTLVLGPVRMATAVAALFRAGRNAPVIEASRRNRGCPRRDDQLRILPIRRRTPIMAPDAQA
jgi:hypothetical protein